VRGERREVRGERREVRGERRREGEVRGRGRERSEADGFIRVTDYDGDDVGEEGGGEEAEGAVHRHRLLALGQETCLRSHGGVGWWGPMEG
jgi:hypothetical protein